ncbi:MAG: hypothetical protein AB8G95_14720 [Anaerolineae bacterium]
MNTMALFLGSASFLIVMGTWAWYLSTIPRGIVPVQPIGSIILQGIGIALAILTFFYLRPGQVFVTTIVFVLAIFSLSMAFFFYWLLTQRKTPLGDLKVSVGDKFLPFDAKVSDGRDFHSNELDGKRILFKFFRGKW